MKAATRDCDMEYRWCDRCYWGRSNWHADGEAPNFKRELRRIFVTQLWLWSIRLKCWAWELDQQTVATLDSELAKPKETGL